MSVNVIANATENMLRASQLQPPTLDSLKAQYKEATQVLGAAGFHGPNDIETLVGLEVCYARRDGIPAHLVTHHCPNSGTTRRMHDLERRPSGQGLSRPQLGCLLGFRRRNQLASAARQARV